MQTAVFLDTNVYLHYRDFDQIDWHRLFKAESLSIIVPMIVLRELNRHKDFGERPRLKKRANTILKKLAPLLDSPQSYRVSEKFDMRMQIREDFDFVSQHLSRDVQDDWIVAAIYAYQQDYPDAQIVLVTSDFGLSLHVKASVMGITVFRLSDDYKLPEEIDVEQRRIQELERELLAYKNSRPALTLEFEEGKQHIERSVFPSFTMSQDEIDSKLTEIKKQYPLMPLPNLPKGITVREFRELVASQPTSAENIYLPEEIENYNARLEKFYEDYLIYLSRYIKYQSVKRRAIYISIVMRNMGTAPAKDIDISLHFPDGFHLIEASQFPNPEEPPPPPSPPLTEVQRLIRSMAPGNYIVSPDVKYELLKPAQSPPNVSRPEIKRTNSYDVNIHVAYLKHHGTTRIGELCIVFETFETSSPFSITYKLIAADVPNPITSELHVIVVKDNSSPAS